MMRRTLALLFSLTVTGCVSTKYDDVWDATRSCAQLYCPSGGICREMGDASLAAGETEAAACHFLRAASLDPSSRAHLDAGRSLVFVGDLPRARAHFESVLAKTTDLEERSVATQFLAEVATPTLVGVYYETASGCPDGDFLGFGPFPARILTEMIDSLGSTRTVKRLTEPVRSSAAADQARIAGATFAVHLSTRCNTTQVPYERGKVVQFKTEMFTTDASVLMHVYDSATGDRLISQMMSASGHGGFQSISATLAVKRATRKLMPTLYRVLMD